MKRILIVEDELLIAKVYSLFLQKMGYTIVSIIQDGDKALEFFRENGADAIVMDIHLKNNTSGLVTARKIRETSAVPIIFTTGNSVAEAEAQSSDIINSVVLIKPVDASEIDRALRKIYNSNIDSN